jgi:hypothetical protein
MKKSKNRIWIIFLLMGGCTQYVGAESLKDSLILKNKDIIVGEIKSLDKGVLTIETDYSEKDFLVEWTGVKEIFCKSRFLITLRNGKRLNGTFYTIDSGKTLIIEGYASHKDTTALHLRETLRDVVFLKGLQSDFWSRATANIDMGLTHTRANNLRQLTGSIKLGYLADKWSVDMYYNDLRSKQDSISLTRRTEAGISYVYYLQRDWFTMASITFLSNTEQALALRSTGKLGMGKYFLHTNRRYWSCNAGLSFNMEKFSNETPARNSLEGYVGSEINLFDIGNFNFFNSIFVFRSLTKTNRWRSDIRLDTKYDFPKDFYAKFGMTLNYDNRSATGNATDYVFAFSVGWELD